METYSFPDKKKKKHLLKKVSLIVATSPIPTHPNTSLIDEAINSVLRMNYPFYQKIISYDKSKKTNKDYLRYKSLMKKKYPDFIHLEMNKHGHFIGSLHNALNYLKTKYFFLVQHDIKLEGNFPINECLKTKLDWNIIATHHFPEEKNDIPEPTHWFPIMKRTKDKNLLKSWGWSERIFLSRRNWMMDKIYEYYHNDSTKNFIESIFHNRFDKLWQKTQGIKYYHEISTASKFMKIYNQFWEEWKCFNLKSKVAYHKHLHGRTRKKKRTKKKRRKRSKR
jgi:hypothetical protein